MRHEGLEVDRQVVEAEAGGDRHHDHDRADHIPAVENIGPADAPSAPVGHVSLPEAGTLRTVPLDLLAGIVLCPRQACKSQLGRRWALARPGPMG
jgi:hypothetical protein